MIVFAFVLLFASTLMQPAVPLPLPAQPRPADPAPGPSTGGPATNSTTALPATNVYADFLYDVAGFALAKFDEKGIDSMNNVWSLPDFLISSRRAENTIDQPNAVQLNDSLVKMALGLMLAAMGLVVGYRVLSVARGELPNPMVVIVIVLGVALAGVVAAMNREILRIPINLVDLMLSTISGAPIKQFVQPAFHVSTTGDRLWGALWMLALLLVTLGLTVVLFIEGAWNLVLGVLMGVAFFFGPLPIVGQGAQFLIRRWMGSLFSPVIVFTALRLAAPTLASILGTNAPDDGAKLTVIALLFVAWQAPGLMVGAITVVFPNIASVYFAGRLLGLGRVSERFIRRGPGDTSSRNDPPRSRANPPTGRGGRNTGRSGEGDAASGRANRMGWSPA